MSRDSTPASLIGGLTIAGSSESSNQEMPVTTRGMRLSQTQRNLAISQHASSGAAAGSSGRRATSSRQPAASRSSGPGTSRPRRPVRSTRTTRPREDDDDDESPDDDDRESDGDSDDDNADNIIILILSTFADTYPSPHSFVTANPNDARGVMGTEQARDCRRLAQVLSRIVAQYPLVLNVLRSGFTRRYCVARLVNNFWKRDSTINQNLLANLEDQAQGRDVSYSIEDWRELNADIERILTDYPNDLTDGHRRSLASLLIKILDRIFQTDRDMYNGRNRTAYAGESNGGNLFRRFLSARARPIEFIGPLHRLSDELLASQTVILQNLMSNYAANNSNGPEQVQYNLVAHVLQQIWFRATGQQA